MDQDDDDMILTGRDALKEVCNPAGSWNWTLIGADPEGLPLAGGGAGFVDEMRECLSELGDGVLFGLVRFAFTQGENQGESLKSKFVIIFATLDEGSSMSAVARGRALATRPAMEKKIGEYCKVVTVVMEITSPDELTVELVTERVKKASAWIDGELVVPERNAKKMFQKATAALAFSRVLSEKSQPSEGRASGAVASCDLKETVVPTPATEDAASEEKEPEAGATVMASDEDTLLVEAQSEEQASRKDNKSARKVAASIVEDESGGICLVKESPQAAQPPCTEPTSEETSSPSAEPPAAPAAAQEKVPAAEGISSGGYNPATATPAKATEEQSMSPSKSSRPIPPPPVFQGFLMAETRNILTGWRPRFFQLREGHLTWWSNQEDAKAGAKPKNSLELIDLQMKFERQSSMIAIRTASSKAAVYNFDVATGENQKPVEEWVRALKKHASFANMTYRYRTAETKYEITLRKTPQNDKLGMDANVSQKTCLVVGEVKGDGLMADWNAANPSKVIKAGDKILAVNGSYGDVTELVETCKTDDVLEMKLVLE